ncbi:hypothetical protein [Streptomyces sp. SM11]|uniref:hypothetical protein n=1 Tax=Streptomyces sp. SM11 TaxID=565557 RepID=UPI0021562860|nr:hypothetical protein [Streptomyces sp. SM11]
MTLTRGARITGAVLCAVLALLITAWLVRDIRAAGGPGPVWHYWAGTADLQDAPRPTTSATSLVLLVAYAAAVAALRSASAASVLIVTGVVTFGLRLPSTWIIADAPAPEELRDRALITTYVVLVASAALIVAGVAGRRPVPQGGERPVGPGRGAGVAAFLLLGFQALVLAAWEIRQPFVSYLSELYPEWFIGGKPLTISLTEGPPGWVTGTIILMLLVAAVGAVAGAAHARPLGLIAGGFVLSYGVLGMARIIHYEMYERFIDLDIEAQLNMLSLVFSLLVGSVVILILARKAAPRASGGLPGPWGGGAGPWGAQPPGHPPYGAPGQPPAPAPGFGPPPGGGFGPPPPPPGR